MMGREETRNAELQHSGVLLTSASIFPSLFSISTILDLVIYAERHCDIVTLERWVTSQHRPFTMTLSDDLRARVVSLYSSGGLSLREVANLLSVSLGFVHNVVSCYQQFG